MKLPKRVTQTFVGRFTFPLDMLRYDSCFPAEADAQKIRRLVDGSSVTGIGTFEVTLAKFEINSSPWNLARWRSFGWEPK